MPQGAYVCVWRGRFNQLLLPVYISGVAPSSSNLQESRPCPQHLSFPLHSLPRLPTLSLKDNSIFRGGFLILTAAPPAQIPPMASQGNGIKYKLQSMASRTQSDLAPVSSLAQCFPLTPAHPTCYRVRT